METRKHGKNYTTKNRDDRDVQALRRAVEILSDSERRGVVIDMLCKELRSELHVQHMTVNINL